MGYAHGTQWNANLIEKGIKDVVEKAKINYFPTHSVIKEITGSYALSNAIRRHGGTRYWAEKLGFEIKPSESKFGEEYELECMKVLKHFGYRCEKTPVRYPYDLLVENNIKVDVKCSNPYHGKTGDFYTFNLEKSKPTCDIFVCYCLEDDVITRVYIIPASALSGNTQLSIGKYTSKYDPYIDKWNYFQKYADFYQSMREAV